MKYFIAVPAMDHVDTEFAESLLNMNTAGDTSYRFETSSLVYESRNKLAKDAVEAESDFVLWLDSDMVFNADLLTDLMKSLNAGYDIVTGLCFARRPNYEPCVWTKLRPGIGDDSVIERLSEIPDSVFDIDACGMAACLMKTSVIKDVLDAGRGCFDPIPGYGEDISFCIRARKLGHRIACDPRVQLGHIAKTKVTRLTWETWKKNGGMIDG